MSKPDGSETILMQNGKQTRRGAIGGLVGAVASPYIAQAQQARASEDSLGGLHIYLTIKAGLEDPNVASDETFWACDENEIKLLVKRAGGIADPLDGLLTKSALASNDHGEGADLVAGAAKTITTRTAMKALSSEADRARPLFLTEKVTAFRGRMGMFAWDSSDLSAEVSIDREEGVYIAPHHDTTGASGAWVRQFTGALNACWFGATGDGRTPDTTAIQGAINLSAALLSGRVYLPAGEYISGTLYFHNDARLNPNFPAGEDHRNGRILLVGDRAVDQPQLRYGNGPTGTVIRFSGSSGSLIAWGNGSGANTMTTRRCEIRDLSLAGNTSGDLLDLNGAGQSPLIQNVSVVNEGSNVLSSSSAVRTRNGLYAGRLVNMHVMGGRGRGMRVESGSMVEFNTVNVTNSLLAWDIGNDPSDLDDTGFGTAATFVNCQARNGTNGVEIRGGRNITMQGWWIEENDGDFDCKIHGNASHITLHDVYFTSTELSVGALVCGGNSGTAENDRARHVKVENCTFNFCGPNNSQAGIVKYGGCDYLEISSTSFKNNGGRGIIIDTSDGVTPTVLRDIDWDPPSAGTAISSSDKVVDQFGTPSQWLVRGLDVPGTITADLDMSSWTHLPDVLVAITSGGDINVTLPTNPTQLVGHTFSCRKAIAGNTLTLTGSINSASSISVNGADDMPTVLAVGSGRYGRLA